MFFYLLCVQPHVPNLSFLVLLCLCTIVIAHSFFFAYYSSCISYLPLVSRISNSVSNQVLLDPFVPLTNWSIPLYIVLLNQRQYYSSTQTKEGCSLSWTSQVVTSLCSLPPMVYITADSIRGREHKSPHVPSHIHTRWLDTRLDGVTKLKSCYLKI